MKQVVDNLLSNAVKYSPPGSAIAADLRMEANGAWRFSVKDQGPGIPAAERHKLFQEFGRLSVQPTAGEKSTGLGLAICRRIVEAHAGTIGADNLPDRGAEFHVTFSPRK
ncbi:MAG: ATP-binding protein, partial [Opitutaceae bacterium]